VSYTPGLWGIEWGTCISVAGIAQVPQTADGTHTANARLIAAAPELLEALQTSRAQWIHSVNAEQCLSAIAKATGDQA
jgi:hypothetical protein